jgi:hypothetical protein
MKFPKNSRELQKVFEHATYPDINSLTGEYLVDMLTVWPSFKRFSHRKVLYRQNDMVTGHNVLFSKVWGHFIVEEGSCRDVYSKRAAVINYNRPENSFPVRRIRDYVRCVERDSLYIGRFYYTFPGRIQFLGYFSLEKLI